MCSSMPAKRRKALDEAINEAGIRPARRDLEPLIGGRAVVTPFKQAANHKPISVAPPAPAVTLPPRLAPLDTKPALAPGKAKRDAGHARAVDPRLFSWQGSAFAEQQKPASRTVQEVSVDSGCCSLR